MRKILSIVIISILTLLISVPVAGNVVAGAACTVPQPSPDKVTLVGTWTQEEKARVSFLVSLRKAYDKRIAIAASSPDGSKALFINADDEFFSACTVKAAYMLSLCKYLDKNGLNADDIYLTYCEEHHHTGSGYIQHAPFGSQYSVRYLIEQALNVSDNVAYVMLQSYFGTQYHNAYMQTLGAESLKINYLWSFNETAKDLCTVWQEIYAYFRNGEGHSTIFRKACTNSPFAYGCLNTKYDYSHKSGDNYGYYAAYSDAGIIWSETPYVFAILTNSEETERDIATVNRVAGILESLFGFRKTTTIQDRSDAIRGGVTRFVAVW